VRTKEPPGLMNVLDWANALARRSIQHFFNSFTYLKVFPLFSLKYLPIILFNI